MFSVKPRSSGPVSQSTSLFVGQNVRSEYQSVSLLFGSVSQRGRRVGVDGHELFVFDYVVVDVCRV